MMKQKKITVKPFINTNLASLELSDSMMRRGDLKYPLYYQITFERRNTQIKSHFNTYLATLDGLRGEDAELIKFETDVLQRTVALEHSKSNGNFTLCGIKEKYDNYVLPLEEVFEIHLKKRLLKVMKYSSTEFLPILKFDGFEVTFSLLFKASKLLIENFTKTIPHEYKEEIEAYQHFSAINSSNLRVFKRLCVMDWLDTDCKIELRNQFVEHFRDKASYADKIVAILDDMVEERIKFL